MRAVIDLMLEVQRAWCSLESIFLGSEDIREQVPLTLTRTRTRTLTLTLALSLT